MLRKQIIRSYRIILLNLSGKEFIKYKSITFFPNDFNNKDYHINNFYNKQSIVAFRLFRKKTIKSYKVSPLNDGYLMPLEYNTNIYEIVVNPIN